MKKLIIYTYLALLLGCAPSIHVRSYLAPAYNFANTPTYYWSPLQEPVRPGNPLLDNKENRLLIKQAIDREMQKKGFVQDSLHPDIYVEYFVKLENKRAVITAPLPFIDEFDMEYRVKVEEIKKGNLVVHIENAEGTKTLWISSAEATIEDIPTDTKHKINNAVKKIMTNLPDITNTVTVAKEPLSY